MEEVRFRKYKIENIQKLPLYAVELTDKYMFKVKIFSKTSYRVFYFTSNENKNPGIYDCIKSLLQSYHNCKFFTSKSDYEKEMTKRLKFILSDPYISELTKMNSCELEDHLSKWEVEDGEDSNFEGEDDDISFGWM